MTTGMLVAFAWVAYATVRMMGSAADAILNANREVEIKAEMRNIANAVKMEYMDTSHLPKYPAECYRNALKAEGRQIPANTGKDPWGKWYIVVVSRKRGGFYLCSSGPDGRWKTQDDIKFFQTLMDIGFRPAGNGGKGTPSGTPE